MKTGIIKKSENRDSSSRKYLFFLSGNLKEKGLFYPIFLCLMLLFLPVLISCASMMTTTPVSTPIEVELSRYAEGLFDETNPYLSDDIVNHASIDFDPLGKDFPFYRSTFWDNFSPRNFEVLETDDEKPNCLGGLQLNYHKWVFYLANEFGYRNPVEMLYWGTVFTAVLRGELTLSPSGSVETSMKRSMKRAFYSFFDYMGLNYAEFSWIAFERMYDKRWVVAMKLDPESGANGFDYWKENKKELPIRVRLPMIESFQYIPREGDIVVGLYNQTNYPRHYISHILFCVNGGGGGVEGDEVDPLFAEQFERRGLFTPFSNLMDHEFDYGFEAILRPFYPVDPDHFDTFVNTPISAFNEPIPDGSIFLAPKSRIKSYLQGHMHGDDLLEAEVREGI